MYGISETKRYFDSVSMISFIKRSIWKTTCILASSIALTDLIVPFINNDTHTYIFTDHEDIDGSNVKFTNNIFKDKTVDLFEISYLSKFCDIIIGRNSGPYTYSETYDNYMDNTKTFLSFNTKNPEYKTIQETMSFDLNLKCKYKTVPILDIHNKNDKDIDNINEALSEVLNEKT